MITYLVTGAAGFIGASLCERLIRENNVRVVGFDNMNSYYDNKLKEYRLKRLVDLSGDENEFVFIKADLCDFDLLDSVVSQYAPHVVVNLAAQAGVRYSIDNPRAYVDSNLVGFFNVLEVCRKHRINHLVFASSSSVYGQSEETPYSVESRTDQPVSFYAATKKANEMMAYSYAKLYGMPCTGLRFFTVYGPAGRPDMAYFKFVNRIISGEPIQLYNMGDMKRDFTFIDDIVDGVVKVCRKIPDATADGTRFKVYNIGNSRPCDLLEFVNILERVIREEGIDAPSVKRELLPMQPGDVYQTYANVDDLYQDFGFKPSTHLEDGLRAFVRWYKAYYDL